MRVLMISDFYPPVVGGMERHVQTLAREMARRGHEVAVATLWREGSPSFEEDEGGVRVHRLSGWNRALAPLYESPEHHFHPTVPDPGVVAGLRRVLARERPQIVHARGWMLYSFLALKPRSGAKLVVTLHDCGLVCSTRAYLYKGQPCTGPAYAKCLRCAAATYGPLKGTLLTTGLRLSRPLHRHIDRYIAVSSAVREASLVGTGIPPREIEVVPTFIPDNVVDEARQVERPSFLPPPEEYILFVGKRNVHKGLDVLLAAHQGVSHLARLVALVTDEGTAESPLPPGVSVVRNASHAQVMAAWQDCAVGVVPSVLPEALPQVGIEAMRVWQAGHRLGNRRHPRSGARRRDRDPSPGGGCERPAGGAPSRADGPRAAGAPGRGGAPAGAPLYGRGGGRPYRADLPRGTRGGGSAHARPLSHSEAAIAAGFYYSGVVPLARWWTRRAGRRLIILVYHRAASGDLRRHLLSCASIIASCRSKPRSKSCTRHHIRTSEGHMIPARRWPSPSTMATATMRLWRPSSRGSCASQSPSSSRRAISRAGRASTGWRARTWRGTRWWRRSPSPSAPTTWIARRSGAPWPRRSTTRRATPHRSPSARASSPPHARRWPFPRRPTRRMRRPAP